jgi:Fe-S-cluster containining protein
MANEKKSFYDAGLRFECQGSGKCCTSRGTYGYVYLSPDDRKRLAAHFGVTTSRFTLDYCAREDGNVFLRNPDRDCRFLEGNRCGVYEARPSQCRTWPFWPENLKNLRRWTKEVVEFCPGVGKGRIYTAEEIERIARAKSGS